MQPSNFYHVALKVDDLETSKEFYQSHFDAKVTRRGEAAESERETAVDYIALEVADKHLYLFAEAPYEAAGLVEELPVGFLHFGYIVDDIEDACDSLEEAGVEFILEPGVFGDLKIAFFLDPNGIRVELLEHI